MTWYVDTSAFAKLVVIEPESEAMRAWWTAHHDDCVSSDLLRTEAMRVAALVSPAAVASMQTAIRTISIFSLDSALFTAAGTIGPATLRSLDALHLCSALLFGDELTGIVAYDQRLLAAASLHGISTISPQ